MFKNIIAAAALVVALGTSASAAELKVVVIDTQRILADSTAAKSLKEELDKVRDKYQADVKAGEEKLRKSEGEFAKQKGVLAKEALAAKQKEFSDEVNKVKQGLQDQRVKIDNGYKNSINEIQKVLKKIVEDMAAEQKFDIAFPSQSLIFATKALDISDEVVKRLNQQLPKVTLKVE